MSGWFGRFVRLAVPAAGVFIWGHVQTQPQVLALLPMIGAFGKYVRDKYPTATWTSWLPF